MSLRNLEIRLPSKSYTSKKPQKMNAILGAGKQSKDPNGWIRSLETIETQPGCRISDRKNCTRIATRKTKRVNIALLLEKQRKVFVSQGSIESKMVQQANCLTKIPLKNVSCWAS